MKKIIILMFTLLICGLVSCTPKDDSKQPDDYLTEEPTKAVDVTDQIKKDFVSKDFTALSRNVSFEEAITVLPMDSIYTITESGTYYFKGSYGGIALGCDELKLHLIFDNVEINTKDDIALNGSNYKKADVTITLIGTNSITSLETSSNAIHIKGSLSFNGNGTLSVISNGKNGIKVSKELLMVDCHLLLTAKNHAISALAVAAKNVNIEILSAGKDGINAECDDETTAFTTKKGYVYLENVDYTCEVFGDGIQADTVIYINGGNYNIKTTGTFVPKTQMASYDMELDDFKYILKNGEYMRIASDETNRYSANQLYGLVQGCKGLKVGEIEYPLEDEEVTVTKGDYAIIIEDGTFTIDSYDDAIHANSGTLLVDGGNFTISTYDDGLTSDVLTKITGGDINITKCYEGLEGAYVEIEDGKINVVAQDDGINAASDDKVNNHIIISGGNIFVNAEGDGVDSNGAIYMTGGSLTIFGPTTDANSALDADGGIFVNGGCLFAVGPLGMSEVPSSNSKQNVLFYAQNQKINASTIISLQDENGQEILTLTTKKDIQSIIISCPSLVKGKTFNLFANTDNLCTFTVNEVITSVGTKPNMGRPGMPPGGFRP